MTATDMPATIRYCGRGGGLHDIHDYTREEVITVTGQEDWAPTYDTTAVVTYRCIGAEYGFVRVAADIHRTVGNALAELGRVIGNSKNLKQTDFVLAPNPLTEEEMQSAGHLKLDVLGGIAEGLSKPTINRRCDDGHEHLAHFYSNVGDGPESPNRHCPGGPMLGRCARAFAHPEHQWETTPINPREESETKWCPGVDIPARHGCTHPPEEPCFSPRNTRRLLDPQIREAAGDYLAASASGAWEGGSANAEAPDRNDIAVGTDHGEIAAGGRHAEGVSIRSTDMGEDAKRARISGKRADLMWILLGRPVPHEQCREILEGPLADALRLFVKRQAEYGEGASTLGSKGQYSDINRKVLKLRRLMWDENVPEDAISESAEQVMMDLIGHLLLGIYEARRGN